MTSNYTKTVSEYIFNTSFENIPKEIVKTAKLCILDSIGCALGGSATEFGKADITVVKELGDNGNSRIIGDGSTTSCALAALLNTSLAHMMDYDDTGTRPPGHPGSSIVQTALTLAEAYGASGKDLIASTILGYEVALRIGEAIRPSARRLKEGPVGGWIAFGPVVVASKLLGLEVDQIRASLGLVGSGLEGAVQSHGAEHGVRWISDKRPGLYKISMGPKAFLGILSALRANNGYPAPLSILDGNFWTALGSDQCDYNKVTDSIGEEYLISRMSFKPYPCCRYLHAPLDGIALLMNDWQIEPDEISKIKILGYQPLEPLMQLNQPGDMWEAEFSLPYTVALILLRKEPGLAWFDKELFSNSRVLEIGKKVVFQLDPTSNNLWFEERKQTCNVVIEMISGESKSVSILHAKGHPEKPLSKKELQKKFMNLATNVVGKENGNKILNTIEHLEDMTDISSLTKYFSNRSLK
jgi:2-methylcitrate dehydratase PrpD